jgi:phosphoribosylaminoimidazole-succinocarboxamide synthase
MKSSSVVLETQLDDLILVNRGKVRDLYEIPGHPDKLLFVATDRVSAYDVVMNEPIPGKGNVLNTMSLFWFDFFSDVQNHLISADVEIYPEVCRRHTEVLKGRSMLVKKVKVLPIECIVRGRWTGSYWSAYKKSPVLKTESPYGSYKEVYGFRFASNILESEEIQPPLFTPSTKAEKGDHDENISLDEMREIVGIQLVDEMERVSVNLFSRAAEYAASRGIILADTKFELGEDENGNLILIDEVLTPDSSRFWPADKVLPGETPPSFDKQYLRDYLSSIGWDKKSLPPTLPQEVIDRTAEKYEEAQRLLVG